MAVKTGKIESELTKGQLRKLNALRKSVGENIGERAFAEWLKSIDTRVGNAVDRNAELIAGTIEGVIKKKKLNIPRGGYLLRRGRGRVLVERAVVG